MFNNTGNNSSAPSVNTRFKTFYGELSCLYVGGWNDNLSLKINPIENVDENGRRNYDFKKKISTALVQEKISALLDEIDKNIIPAIEEKKEEFTSAGYQVGKDASAAFIEWDKDDNNVWSVYITIYKNIQQDNTSDTAFKYKFNKTAVIENYDAEKGTGDEKQVEGEFLTFVSILRSAVEMLGIAQHGIRYQQELDTRSSGFNTSSFMGGNTPTMNNQYSAETRSFDDEGDLLF